jgi:hypothetical protein
MLPNFLVSMEKISELVAEVQKIAAAEGPPGPNDQGNISEIMGKIIERAFFMARLDPDRVALFKKEDAARNPLLVVTAGMAEVDGRMCPCLQVLPFMGTTFLNVPFGSVIDGTYEVLSLDAKKKA